ncbi:head-tail connector protein [Lysobacter auxotrophicus]|uniref:Head-tail connector protein n=1 Tax=Lysobacter auxotrophicus TaxID=2992573 RepID=A0ABM8DG06_9GAMM|nr:head-tail connector protein [Lysobacter auxotrophicus]BDU17527.1 head-tail connector protein [Lysobacter auxotrophicus]
MGLRRTTEPGVEPVTLAEAKLHLRVDSDAEDAKIVGLIKTARTDCEFRIGRTLITSGWTLTLDCFAQLAELPMPPAISITSLKYTDTSGAEQTLAPSAYRVDLSSDPARVEPVGGWPATASVQAAVRVVFTAGYGESPDAVPSAAKDWILLAVGDLYANRERSSEKVKVPMDFADALLDPLRIWG